MGWYGGGDIPCPKCNGSNAVESYRNSMLSDYHLVCPDCGLCLYCKEKKWVVTSSYINSTLIGRNPDSLMPDELVQTDIDSCVLPPGMPVYFKTIDFNIGFMGKVVALAIGAIVLIYCLRFLPG